MGDLSPSKRHGEKQIRTNDTGITVMTRFTITVIETEIYENLDVNRENQFCEADIVLQAESFRIF